MRRIARMVLYVGLVVPFLPAYGCMCTPNQYCCDQDCDPCYTACASSSGTSGCSDAGLSGKAQVPTRAKGSYYGSQPYSPFPPSDPDQDYRRPVNGFKGNAPPAAPPRNVIPPRTQSFNDSVQPWRGACINGLCR